MPGEYSACVEVINYSIDEINKISNEQSESWAQMINMSSDSAEIIKSQY